MQIDMHFYGVYAMARAAGLDPVTAETIANASQFVDDAVDDDLHDASASRNDAQMQASAIRSMLCFFCVTASIMLSCSLTLSLNWL